MFTPKELSWRFLTGLLKPADRPGPWGSRTRSREAPSPIGHLEGSGFG